MSSTKPTLNQNEASAGLDIRPILIAGGLILVAGVAAWAAYAPSFFVEALRTGWSLCFG